MPVLLYAFLMLLLLYKCILTKAQRSIPYVFAITQLRNYAIVNTNEYECIRSQHKFVFIRIYNCVISEASLRNCRSIRNQYKVRIRGHLELFITINLNFTKYLDIAIAQISLFIIGHVFVKA